MSDDTKATPASTGEEDCYFPAAKHRGAGKEIKICKTCADSGEPMSFGHALALLKDGKKVARSGWNGKNMFIYLVRGSTIKKEDLRAEAKQTLGHEVPDGGEINIGSHIDMKAADGSIVCGWLASQTDLLAEDYYLVK